MSGLSTVVAIAPVVILKHDSFFLTGEREAGCGKLQVNKRPQMVCAEALFKCCHHDVFLPLSGNTPGQEASIQKAKCKNSRDPNLGQC